jgi:hypothetical protein
MALERHLLDLLQTHQQLPLLLQPVQQCSSSKPLLLLPPLRLLLSWQGRLAHRWALGLRRCTPLLSAARSRSPGTR